MAGEVEQAFSHPILRATQTTRAAPDALPDRLIVRDHVVSAEIGAFRPERGRTQRLQFDVVTEVGVPGDHGDDVDRILSYDRITEAIAAELSGERLNLLETLADRIAARILREPQARRVFLRIQKLDRGPGTLGIEIVRSRDSLPAPGEPSSEPTGGPSGELTGKPSGEPTGGPAHRSGAFHGSDRPRPRLVVLTGPDADVPLVRWLDALGAEDAPVVFCIGRGDLTVPQAGDDATRRQVGLLALNQAAWLFAARDPRLTVVESRTELDWSLRNGRPVVWAPAKMTNDAPDAPDLSAADLSGALALWLAGASLLAVAPVPPMPGAVSVDPGAERLP